MNIIIIRPNTSDFGKVGTYNVQEIGLANALSRKGYSVSVLFLHRLVFHIEKDEMYDFVYYLPHVKIGLHGIFYTQVLKKFNPGKIIIFSDNQFWSKNIIKWAKKYNIPCINYFGAVLSDNKKWLHQFYTKLILFRNFNSYKYSLNIAKTEKVRKEMFINNIQCNKVIPIGLDSDLLYKNVKKDVSIKIGNIGFNESDKIILFVGRLVPYKNPILACKILENLLLEDSHYKLIIIGKGEMKETLLNYIKEKNLSNCIYYIEKVEYSEMHKYMMSSNCLINLSDKEIFGMTILEAMFYMVPVIAHVAPGPNDIIINGYNGYLLNTEDINIWSKTIKKAISQNLNLSINAKNTILEKYTWDSIVSQFLLI